MAKIAIIGSGLSGLSAAYLLKDRAEVTVFEKARGVSGRMSTRRAEPYFFDHGAQYFTARTQPFQYFIQPLLSQRVIERWNARYVKFDGSKIVERKNWIDDEPRYVGVPGMNAIAKHLAEGMNVCANTRITSMKYQRKWQLIDDQNQQYSGFDWVICTAPAPQAKGLLPEFFKYYDDIKAIEMRACFSLMLGFERGPPLEFDAAHIQNADLNWIAVNSHKPGRAGHFALTVHSAERFAEAAIDDDPDEVMKHLIAQTSRIVGYDVSGADYKTVHKWRYANNANINEENNVFLDHRHKLAACGDWCLGGRVEGAFTSSYNLVNEMKERVL